MFKKGFFVFLFFVFWHTSSIQNNLKADEICKTGIFIKFSCDLDQKYRSIEYDLQSDKQLENELKAESSENTKSDVSSIIEQGSVLVPEPATIFMLGICGLIVISKKERSKGR
jgi:hypothetical protein